MIVGQAIGTCSEVSLSFSAACMLKGLLGWPFQTSQNLYSNMHYFTMVAEGPTPFDITKVWPL